MNERSTPNNALAEIFMIGFFQMVEQDLINLDFTGVSCRLRI